MYHIIALGELLIDFTPGGYTEEGVMLYQRNPGGAPANVLAMAACLGCVTGFIGKVGADSFGAYLKEVLESKSIDVSGLVVDGAVPTTLAFVNINEQGERSFGFYRNPGADMMLEADEVNLALVKSSRVFHFGSLSLVPGPCRKATLKAAECARQGRSLISYDPNYRPLLWQSEAAAVEQMLTAVPLAHVLKVSEEEATLLTGEANVTRAAQKLADLGPQAVLVTRGRAGAYWLGKAGAGQVRAFAVHAVDTTGAGDAFMGTVLARLALTEQWPDAMSREDWENTLEDACAAGSLAASRKGAINAMPDAEEIEHCRKNTPKV